MAGGVDAVVCLFQQASDVADAFVDCLGPDAEQGGNGGLGQAEAVVQHGGQEPVGEGEAGAAVCVIDCLQAVSARN